MIFCIIPAYNEEKNIIKVVNNVIPLVDKIVIIDDASTDKTVETLYKKFSNDKLIILQHIVNRGQGAALQTGNEYAVTNNAKIIIHFDADGQFLSHEIKDIIEPIQKNEADIVFGSRFLEKKSKIPWLKEKIIMPLARIANKIFAKNNLTDPQGGFRAMRANIANTITIEQDRMAHCSEIINKTFSKNIKSKEIPITVIYNEFGQKLGGGVNIIKELILGRLLN